MIAVEAMPLGEICAYWDAQAGRGYTFVHPRTHIVVQGALDKIYHGAAEHADTLVGGQVGYSDDASHQNLEVLRQAVRDYIPKVWHPIEVQVAIHVIVSAFNGEIPNTLDPDIFQMMERV